MYANMTYIMNMENKEPTMLQAFSTKTELQDAFSKANAQPDNLLAEMITVYTPHQYRGGWMIRGFGYSTERIGAYVPADQAGIPQ